MATHAMHSMPNKQRPCAHLSLKIEIRIVHCGVEPCLWQRIKNCWGT